MGKIINRRAALFGAAVSTAALAVPAAAAIGPSEGDKLQQFLDTASAEDLVQHHASRLASALCAARPGLWRFSLEHFQLSSGAPGHVLFHRYDSPSKFNGYAQDFN